MDKVRVQLLDKTTGEVIKEVDVLTSADAVLFNDGETFQQKLDSGLLNGVKGDTGVAGASGENVRVGTDYETGTQVKLFLKTV